MTVPRVLVGRHRVHARVVGRSRAGETALLTAVADGLAEALESAPAVDGYWILRELAVSTRVGATWTSVRMSRALAVDVAGAVAEMQRAGIDSRHALWFPDRAAFLACFLHDLAEGRAGGRWEYAGLPGLAHPGSALDELATAEPDVLPAALTTLTLGTLEALARLTVDEEIALARLAPAGGAGGRAAVLATLGTLLSAGRQVGPLVLSVAAAREHRLPLASVVLDAVACSGLAALVRQAGPAAAAALRRGDWAELSGYGEDFLAVVSWPAADREHLAEVLATDGARPSSGSPRETTETPFGGAFLLAPLLDDLADWPRGEQADCVRLVVLTAALGRGDATLHDPLLRSLYGLAPHLDPRCVVDGLDRPVPALASRPATSGDQPERGIEDLAKALLASLGRHLPGMAAASPAYLRANVLDLGARVTSGDDEPGTEHVVELGHPPLAVLLSLAGLTSGTVRIRGHEEVRWRLTTAP